MIINWHGEGSFRIQSGETALLTDPLQKEWGLAVPRAKTDLVIKTITSWPLPQPETEEQTTIVHGAGEYDLRGIKIRGIQVINESSKQFFKTIYVLRWDDISIGLLGAIEQEPSPEIKTYLEGMDVLIGPGGGAPFIEQAIMNKLIKQLNPKLFIPSFFKVKGLKRTANDVAGLVELFDGEVEGNQEKLVFKKKDIADIKKTKMVWLAV